MSEMRLNKLYEKILGLFLIIVFASSCESLDQLNDNPNAKDKVSSNFVLTYVETNLSALYYELGDFNSGIAGVLQYTQAGTNFGADEMNQYLWERQSWEAFYDLLRNTNIIYEQSVEDQNKLFEGIARTLRAFLYGTMTDLYGDVPYSESLKAAEGSFFPKYDEQITVYKGVLEDLKTAERIFASQDINDYVIDPNADLLYNGNPEKWRRFSNSLRLRYSMRLMNKKDKLSEIGIDLAEEFKDASKFCFDSNSDDATIEYIGSTSSNSAKGGKLRSPNPPHNYKPSKTVVDILLSLDDPRLQRWVRPVQKKWQSGINDPENYLYTDAFNENHEVLLMPLTGKEEDTSLYVGLPVGLSINDVVGYNSGGSDEQFDPERSPFISFLNTIYFENAHRLVRMDLMRYSEVEFLQAEAAERSVLPASKAEMHYRNGIISSMERWEVMAGMTGFDFDDYYDNPDVSYSESTDKIGRIMEQKWLAGWLSVEPWFDWRRTGLPDLKPGPVTAYGPALPLRFMYPSPGQDSRYLDNYNRAIERLEPTRYVPGGQTADHSYSRMWLLQGTNKPY